MAPKTADKKAAPKSNKVGRKAGKKGKKSVESWKIYIYKVAVTLSPLDPLSYCRSRSCCLGCSSALLLPAEHLVSSALAIAVLAQQTSRRCSDAQLQSDLNRQG